MRVLAVLCAAGLLTPRIDAQTADFRSRVESVRLDTLITERGLPLIGLRAADFELFDNGVRQTVDYVSLDALPVNVVEVLDMSQSVSGAVQEQLRVATLGVSRGLRSGDQSALITFSHRVTLALGLTDAVESLGPALAPAQASGGTALRDAAYASLWIAEPDPGRAVIIIFSDGRDTSSWLSRERVLDASKRVDATIYAVASGRQRDQFLSDLTELTGGRVFDAASTSRIAAAFDAILSEFRQRYVISYTPARVTTRGWHKVELRVKGHRANIKVREGYLAGPG